MDFLHKSANANKTFQKSDMIFKIHSNLSYLLISNAISGAGGYFYLGNNFPITNDEP